MSLRGYPAKMISDSGTQLTEANEELKKVVAYWDSIPSVAPNAWIAASETKTNGLRLPNGITRNPTELFE